MTLELPEEYKEYLRQTTGWLERAGDALTTMDERVNYVVGQLQQVLAGGVPAEVAENISRLIDAIETLAAVQGVEMIGRTEEIRFQQTVPPATGMRLVEPTPFHGYITTILRHWPNGCNALVDVAVGYGNMRLLPASGFVALNDATPVFDGLRCEVQDGELLWVEIENHDGLQHTITVTFTIEEIVG